MLFDVINYLFDTIYFISKYIDLNDIFTGSILINNHSFIGTLAYCNA